MRFPFVCSLSSEQSRLLDLDFQDHPENAGCLKLIKVFSAQDKHISHSPSLPVLFFLTKIARLLSKAETKNLEKVYYQMNTLIYLFPSFVCSTIRFSLIYNTEEG